jgi:asparagine synthase (glutamine-hydrolysing)
MTAIGGLIGISGCRIDSSIVDRMASTLECYGQDSTGKKSYDDRGMFRCLLRTTPEDRFDLQPMIDRQTGIWMVFDGRLDNRNELRKALSFNNDVMSEMSDGQLALYCVRVFGEKSVSYFEGDFALASYDSSKNLLWLARDPLGSRPLFWCASNGYIGFSSMPKALFCIPGLVKEVDRQVMHDYLCLLPMPENSTFYKGVRKVAPGGIERFQNGVRTSRKYHTFTVQSELRLNSDEEYLEAFAEQFETAVRSRLRSNSEIGAHLSSGLDSGAVTAIAARQLAAASQSLTAFTSVPRRGFHGKVPPGHHGDEGPGAREVASRFANIEHVLVRTRQGALKAGMDLDVERLDRTPLNGCNMTWARAIEEEAQRRGIKVLLTGRMGNYSISYQGWEYLPWLLRSGKFATWWKECTGVLQHFPRFGRRRLLARSIHPLLPKTIWQLRQWFRGTTRDLDSYSPLNSTYFSDSVSRRRASKRGWDLTYQPWSDGRQMRVAALNRFDSAEYSVCANASNVEMRSPAMDRRLIEFCLSIPDNQFFRGGRPGWLLERMMGSTLPNQAFGLPTKGLQFADWYEQFDLAVPAIREELEKLASNSVSRELLDVDGLIKDLDQWESTEPGSVTQERMFRLRQLRGLTAGAFIRYAERENE